MSVRQQGEVPVSHPTSYEQQSYGAPDTQLQSTFASPSTYLSNAGPPIPPISKSPLSMTSALADDAQSSLGLTIPRSQAGVEAGPSDPPPKNRKAGNPPRPPNAWICYRSARVHELKNTSQYVKMPQASISKLIGELWRAESPEVRKKYEKEAAAKKLEHQAKYPDYSFRPVRKDTARKSSTRKNASASTKKESASTELPSVLRPGPPTVSSGLPSLASPSTTSTESFPQYPGAIGRNDSWHYASTSSSISESPLHSATMYSLPSPADEAYPLPGPIENSHSWAVFHPAQEFQPAPAFDRASRAPPSFYYAPYEAEDYVIPSHCTTASSSSSQAFDYIDPYHPPPSAAARFEGYHQSQEQWKMSLFSTQPIPGDQMFEPVLHGNPPYLYR